MTAIWMFTGQGSLVPGCAQPLYEANAVFKEALDRYTVALERSVDVPLLGLLLDNHGAATELVQQTQYGQPAVVALQLAQLAMWRDRGATPAVVLGHSVGELAAAVAAGVMQPEDALRLAAVRGRVMSECRAGAMAAVMAPAERLLSSLPPEIVIAADNGPTMTVLAGTKDALRAFLAERCRDPHTMLPVSHAFHSPLMEPAARAFREHVETTALAEPRDVQLVSTMTGDVETAQLRSPDYWIDQILRPVAFQRAVRTAWALSPAASTVVELGPASTLLQLAQRFVPDPDRQWIASSQA
ncbi:MAG TPA: acyltransferase domain-containing protein, partial [Kofleriaceae bacterium]|nr:acyltransferase domain-containing protein [Kofleriaceae bacterium]